MVKCADILFSGAEKCSDSGLHSSTRRTLNLEEILANHLVPRMGTLWDMTNTPSVEEAGLRTQRLICPSPKVKSLRQFESS